VIGWLVDLRRGRMFWVAAVNRIFEAHGDVRSAEQRPTEEPGAPRTEALQRWVQ
jgi:hypothetical protein